MGRKKLDTMDYITNENLRNIAYSKRKKGLVKKAMELSKLCGVDIHLVVFDKKKQRLIEFSSSNEFSAKAAEEMIDNQNNSKTSYKFEKYTNAEYDRYQNLNKTSNSIPPVASK